MRMRSGNTGIGLSLAVIVVQWNRLPLALIGDLLSPRGIFVLPLSEVIIAGKCPNVNTDFTGNYLF